MLARTRARVRFESSGFSLIELLVVIVIIGLLAAIAIPVFLGQRTKANDTEAKTNARNLVSKVSSCRVETDDFSQCDSEAELTMHVGAKPDLPIGTGPGEVQVENASSDSYEATAVSRADSGGANHKFTIKVDLRNAQSRTCSPVGEGGCSDTGDW